MLPSVLLLLEYSASEVQYLSMVREVNNNSLVLEMSSMTIDEEGMES